MIVEHLLQINCKYCRRCFLLCRSCYRGQCYCCGRCRFIAQRASLRRAQYRYRQTEKGLKAHREAEKRRRSRKNKKPSQSVDDEGSTPPTPRVILSFKPLINIGFCHYCGVAGVIVENFPRRAYGGRRSGRYYGKQKTS